MNDCNGRGFNRSMHPPRSSLWPYSLVVWSFTERKLGDLPTPLLSQQRAVDEG